MITGKQHSKNRTTEHEETMLPVYSFNEITAVTATMTTDAVITKRNVLYLTVFFFTLTTKWKINNLLLCTKHRNVVLG